MVSEKKSELLGIPIEFDEGTEHVRKSVCAECGGPLTLPWGGSYGHQGYLLQCGKDRAHRGIRSVETAVDYIARREGGGDRFMAMLRSDDGLQMLIADVRHRLIDHDKQVPDRDLAAFVIDCAKLGLDPFTRQIYPVPFEDRSQRVVKDGRTVEQVYRLATIIATRGLASIAQRAMPDTWVMPPSGEPVKRDDPIKALLLEGATRKGEWKGEPGQRRQEAVPVDPARVLLYRVKGKVRAHGEILDTDWVYGMWHLDDEVFGTDKGNTPMRMAQRRAERAWYEDYFPAAKAIMQGLTVPMLERASGFISAMRIVEGKAVVVEPAALPERVAETPQAVSSPVTPPASAGAPAPRTTGGERMASANQTNALYAISRAIGWDRDRLVRELGGKAPDELAFADASLAIDRLRKLEEAAKPKLTQ